MFVAQYGLAGFEIAHAVELEPAQDAADGGPAEACGLRDAQPGPALTAQCLDPLRQLRLGGPTQAERPATTVHKSGLPQLAIACHPFGRGLRAHVGGGCGRRQRASALDHPLGHLFSTPNHRSCILVIVHLVSWITESSQTQLYRSRSDGQSIETSHLVPTPCSLSFAIIQPNAIATIHLSSLQHSADGSLRRTLRIRLYRSSSLRPRP